MTKSVKVKKANAAQLAEIETAGFDQQNANLATVALLKKAGFEDPAVKRAYKIGIMTRRLMTATEIDGGDNVLKEAREARRLEAIDAYDNRCGNGKTVKGKRARTKAQEQALSTANSAWNRVRRDAGIVSAAPGAGNQNAKGKGKGKGKDKGQSATPKAKDRNSARDYFQGQAATMMAYVAKNGDILKNDDPLVAAVVAFNKAILSASKPETVGKLPNKKRDAENTRAVVKTA